MGDWLGCDFLSYQEAVNFIKTNLGVITREQFKRVRPTLKVFIPSNPNKHYQGKGWTGWTDFLDPDRQLRRVKATFANYKEAKKIVQEKLIPLGINSISKIKLCDIHLVPPEIPLDPFDYYSHRNEWISAADFFGTNNKKPRARSEFLTYPYAKEWCRLNLRPRGITSNKKYRDFITGKIELDIPNPGNLPAVPSTFYNDQWRGWGNYLGTGNVLSKNYWPYKKAQYWVRKNVTSFGVNSHTLWSQYIKGELKIDGLQALDNRVPGSPKDAYRTKGWKGWDHWLSIKKEKVFTYKEARRWIHVNFKKYVFNSSDWIKYIKGTHPLQDVLPEIHPYMPKDPEKHYALRSLKSKTDFWGENTYWPYPTARHWYIRHLSHAITNKAQWNDYLRGKYPELPPLPAEIPKKPSITYAKYLRRSPDKWFVINEHDKNKIMLHARQSSETL